MARVSSALGLFVSQANVRGFLLDMSELLEFPAGTLESILTNAGLDTLEAAVSQVCATVDELALVAIGEGGLAPGYTPNLLHTQLIESVEKCHLSTTGVKAVRAMQRAGYSVGVFSNLAGPYRDKVAELAERELGSTWAVYSCDQGCVQPSLSSLREFCSVAGLKPRQVMLVVGDVSDKDADDNPRASPIGGGTGLDKDDDGRSTIVNPARALAIGMHCVCLRPSAIPEQVVSVGANKAACLWLPDYTMQHFVGEVLGFPAPLDATKHGFGPYSIPSTHVFTATEKSLGIVNHRAAAAGHVLVIPRRRVARFSDMGADEVADLWSTAQRVGEMIALQHRADGVSFVLQDGEAAGQSVSHVHIHCVPRFDEEATPAAELFDRIENNDQRRPADGLSRELEPPAAGWGRMSPDANPGPKLPEAGASKPRSYTELSTEASVYKRLMSRMAPETS